VSECRYFSGFVRSIVLIWMAACFAGMGCASALAQTPKEKAPLAKKEAAAKADPANGKTAPDGDAADAGTEKEWLQLPLDDAARKAYLQQIGQIIAAGNVTPAQKQMIQNYYKKFALPSWTIEASWTSLPDKRKQIRDGLQRTAKTPAIHDLINDILLETLPKMAVHPDLHPSVRISAALMIGDLNAVEKTATVPAEALPGAVPVLLNIVQSPAKDMDSVKVAAMVGLGRHASMGLNAVAQPEVAAAMVRLAATPVPKAPDAAGRIWMRAQAAEVLGSMGEAGPKGEAANALREVVADSSLPLSVRSVGARALGRLKYTAGSVDAQTLIDALNRLAKDALAAEVDRERIAARRIKSHLESVLGGLKAVASVAKTAGAKLAISSLQAQIDSVMKAADAVDRNGYLTEEAMTKFKAAVENLDLKKTSQ
jgi:hypothetical protein